MKFAHVNRDSSVGIVNGQRSSNSVQLPVQQTPGALGMWSWPYIHLHLVGWLPPLPHITSRRATPPQPSRLERARSESARCSEVESVVMDRTESRDNKRPFAFQCPVSSFPRRRSCWLYLSAQLVVWSKLQLGCTVSQNLQSWTSLAAVCLLLIQAHSAPRNFHVSPMSTACSHTCGSFWTLLPTLKPDILTEVAFTFHLLFKTNVGDTAWK